MARTPCYSIEIVPAREWDGLVQQFPDRTVFHFLPWLQTICASHGLQLTLTKAVQGDRCLAVWPHLHMRKGPLKVIGSPLPGWSTSYLGPLFNAETDVGAALKSFLQHREFRRYAYFACKVIDQNRTVDLRPFGFSTVLKYQTYRLKLSTLEADLWKNCRRECRNHIRKAMKHNVEVRSECSPDVVDAYWRMSVETFAKAGVVPTHNKRLVEQVWKNLIPTDHATFLSAYNGPTRIATILLLSDDQTMYYWGGASHLEYRHLSAHNLLQWEAIRLAKERGLLVYDFVSTTGGPGKFKQSFGPQVVDIATHWERSASRLLSMIKVRYERYLRRRQRTTPHLSRQLPSAELVH